MTRIAITDRREALLAAALRVIARDGVAHASTRAIAAEADMPVASFHYVFASRDAMLQELIEAVVEGQRAAVAIGVGETVSLTDFVGAALHGWLDRALLRPETEVALHELVTWSRWAPGMGGLAATIYRHHEETALSFIDAAHALFGTVWSVPDGELARLVIVITDGVADRWLVDRDEQAARRMLEHGVGLITAFASAPLPAVTA